MVKPKNERTTTAELLIAKARERFRPVGFYLDKGNKEAVVQTLNVVVINAARAVLASRGYGIKPTAAAKTFTKRFVVPGELPEEYGTLLKSLAHLNHEADFNPRFSTSETELKKLASNTRDFLAAAEEYLKKA